MDKLIEEAKNARELAYAPYSKYKVGAAVMDEKGNIFKGCNIENASYGATMCAERTAIYKAVSEGAKKIKALAVSATDSMPYPCGMCRQVMSEFMEKDAKIYVESEGNIEIYTMLELLPKMFEL